MALLGLAALPACGASTAAGHGQHAGVQPQPLYAPTPAYVDEARAAGVEGSVTVESRVACDGHVRSARVTRWIGHGLDESALAAAMKTRFEPSSDCPHPEGVPVAMKYTFRMGD
jgi:TonB family protein